MKSITKKQVIYFLENSGLLVAIFAVCTGICFLLDLLKVNDLNFLIIYILGILVNSVFTKGYVYSAILSVLSVLGYNFFFTVPRMTLKINDSGYIATFILMFIVGIGISAVTFQLKKKMSQVNKLSIEKIELKNEADKELQKATLLRSISHDLRTPLTAIKNGAELMIKPNSISEKDKKEILVDIAEKSEWTIRLVENLLLLSRIDSEKLTVKKSPEAVEEVVPQAVGKMKGILGGRKLHYDMTTELLLVPMDAVLIMQVIVNIINNAVKHTKDNGNIWFKVFSTGKNVVFRISNDGEPIKEEDLPHVFEMYYTADKKNDGGLGLSICEMIVRAHGGEISARCSEERVIFEFILPLEEKDVTSIDN